MTSDAKPQPSAIIYCEGAFATPNGKTAHGLVRRSERWRISSVIDSRYAGCDAREVLDETPSGIPIVTDLRAAGEIDPGASHLLLGLAPDGGRLPSEAREVVQQALDQGLSVVSGLHDFLSDDPDLVAFAERRGASLFDVRKPPSRDTLHFFSGKIEEVDSFKIAVLGTDSAVGKRTTAWLLVDAMRAAGYSTELIGTGQTAWMQGAEYSLVLDSLINDFVSGEIEHAVWSAWSDRRPNGIVLEGQGSLLNPAYPGGFELLAAGRPNVVVLQHAPKRLEYDGFPGYVLHSIEHQIRAVEVVSGRSVVAITINHEGMAGEDEVHAACQELTRETGLPAFDVLKEGAFGLVEVMTAHGLEGSARKESS